MKACICLISCLVTAGCTTAAHLRPQGLTEDLRSQVHTEVTAVIHGYMAGYSAARCDDVTPVSRFVRDGELVVTASAIIPYQIAETERELRSQVCGWTEHTGVVDSVVVDVLSRDVAVAAWLYHDEVKLKTGELKRFKGSALMTLVRYTDGWKITSTMAAFDSVCTVAVGAQRCVPSK